MYSVSEEYLDQMMHRGTRRRLSGMIGSVAFTGDDIVKGTFSISMRATEESDTKIGGVYLGELEMTFVPSFLSKVARDQYRGKEVSISIGLWIPDPEDLVDGGSWEDVPCGTFTLEAPKISKQGISVTGYDNMKKLDKKFTIDETSGSPYAFLSYMATQCSVTLGQEQEEIEALPNGTELLGIYTAENDIETFRDMLYWLAQTLGCFACADREGNIVVRKLGMPNTVGLDESHRDADVVFSGYTTKWTGISVVDMETQTTMYYGLEIDDGLTMNLGSNPFLQLGSALAVERRRRNVLYAVADIQYTPFYANSARDPIFDLGDVLPFTGGLSGNCTGCIMALNWSLDNYTFEGYGDDPALANARSKTDKNISGLMKSTTENEIVFHNFSNVMAQTFGSEEEITIASLAFTSAQPTTVKIMHEFIFDMLADLASDCSYELRYYLDNELLSYSPYERIGGLQGASTGTTEASITRDFFYILKDVEPNLRHTWKVSIITHGVTSTTIDVDHAHITLEGQRLYGETYFDGYISVEEDFTVVGYGYLEQIAVTDSALVSIVPAAIGSGSDTVETFDIPSMSVMPIEEGTGALSPHVFLQTEYGHILTESEDSITTESGDRLIL